VPVFKPELLKRLELANNAFLKSFSRSKTVKHKMVDESTTLGIIRLLIRSSITIDEGIEAAAELAVQSYIQEVISIMAQRWNNGKRTSSTKFEEYINWAGLTKDEASGLQGLSREMAQRLSGVTELCLALSRPYTDSTKPRNGAAIFARYDTGLWVDKLYALFALDDESTKVKRSWGSLNFRQLTRQLHTLIVNECGSPQGDAFMETVRTVAARVLWVIP
jgi:hypothetical protein